MQKARFMERQPPVKWQPVNNGMMDVTICLNGQMVTEGEESAPTQMWEYDFHQFREKEEKLNEDQVRASPEKYLDYTPEREKNLQEKLKEQQSTIEMLTECLLEISELVYQ